MSRSAYARDWCFVCGKYVTVSGAARTSHNRKHVREGKMIEEKVWEGNYYHFRFRRAPGVKGIPQPPWNPREEDTED